MRPIKFRGIDWETGEYVYGDLIQGNYDEVCPRIKPRKKKARYVKDVAQLVGYDANGKEVYEGDTVIEEYVSGKRQENIAPLVSMTQVPETAEFFFFPFPAPFTILKEADQ